MMIKGKFVESNFYAYDYNVGVSEMVVFAKSFFKISFLEFGLDGKRFDVIGFKKNSISIIEVKSSVNDFRYDKKWRDYRVYCNRLFFVCPFNAVKADEVDDCGLIYCFKFRNNIIDKGWKMGGYLVKHSDFWRMRKKTEIRVLRKALWNLS